MRWNNLGSVLIVAMATVSRPDPVSARPARAVVVKGGRRPARSDLPLTGPRARRQGCTGRAVSRQSATGTSSCLVQRNWGVQLDPCLIILQIATGTGHFSPLTSAPGYREFIHEGTVIIEVNALDSYEATITPHARLGRNCSSSRYYHFNRNAGVGPYRSNPMTLGVSARAARKARSASRRHFQTTRQRHAGSFILVHCRLNHNVLARFSLCNKNLK